MLTSSYKEFERNHRARSKSKTEVAKGKKNRYKIKEPYCSMDLV